jgi:hypothetical protein
MVVLMVSGEPAVKRIVITIVTVKLVTKTLQNVCMVAPPPNFMA